MADEEFPPCNVYYIPPEEALTQETMYEYDSGRKQLQKKAVNLEEIYESIKDVLYRFIDAEAAGTPITPDMFRWDMFEQLGIPDQSYFKLNQNIKNLANFSKVDFTGYFWHIFQRFNTDPKIQSAFTFPAEGGELSFSRANMLQVLWYLTVKSTSANDDLDSFSKTHGEDEAYKIHLCPKHPYILYTMCRLLSIAKRYPVFYNKNMAMKIVFTLRATKPREENTYIVKTAGGALPTLVFYCNENVEAVKEFLEILLAEFESEVDIVGAMTPEYVYRVLPFNVRLNSLLFYALGDRGYKNDTRKEFMRIVEHHKSNNLPEYLKKFRDRYTMPTWVESMMEKCGSKQAARVGDLSMRFFGKNICLPETRAMLADPNCLDDICWLSPFKDMLSPLTLKGLGLDDSKRTDEEADTTANNLVVHGDTEAHEDPRNPSPPLRANRTFHPTMNNNNNNYGTPSMTFPPISNMLPGFFTRKQGGRRKKTRRTRGGFRFSVKFKGVEAANNLRPRNQTLTPPQVSWSANSTDMFTLVMWDPDAPNPSFVHWFITNIPGSQIQKGIPLVPYMPPSPPSGIHRYYVTLFKQSGTVSPSSVNRSGFSLDAFVRNYGLNKVAEKMIKVSAGKN